MLGQLADNADAQTAIEECCEPTFAALSLKDVGIGIGERAMLNDGLGGVAGGGDGIAQVYMRRG